MLTIDLITVALALFVAVRARRGMPGIAGVLFGLGFAVLLGGWWGVQVTFPEPESPPPATPISSDAFLGVAGFGVLLMVAGVAVHLSQPPSGHARSRTSPTAWFAAGILAFHVLLWPILILWIWTSTTWTPRQKLIGTVSVPGGPSASVLLMFIVLGGSSPGPAKVVLLTLLAAASVAPLWQAVYLWRAAEDAFDAAVEQPGVTGVESRLAR